jgi:probable DNA repair protein
MGVLEAAGAESDHLWIGGMDEEAWPGGASPNPFVPRSLQREHGLPLGSPGRRLELARKITRRLMASAPEVVVSHANRSGDREVRVSPLFQQVPRKLGETTRFQLWQRRPAPMQELDDQTAPEVTRGVAAQGGVRTIQLQAACPFRAFGEIRLRAGQVKRPDQGLDPQKRGVLLHRMLERCWRELRSLDALRKLNAWELKALVERAAGEAVAKEEFDARMKELETRRLSRIALDWLQLERERKVDFEVEQFERQRQVSLGGLDLDTRIDRVDKLEDGRRVLIDYKSSTPSPAQWNGERPEDPQIPVYAASMAEPLAGALFAQVRPGHLKFSGIASMKDLVPDIRAVSDQKFAEKVSEWKTVVEKLAAAYAGGRAEVDPKEKSKTCQRCHLATLCRIHEKAMREDG